MKKFFCKEYFFLLFIFCSTALLSAIVFRNIYPIHFGNQTLFIFDLIGYPVSLPIWFMYFAGFLDILLFWLIGKLIIKGKWGYLPVVIFIFSPWFIYSVATGSFYVYLLSLILSCGLSILYIKSGKQRLGSALFVVSSGLLIFSSFVGLVTYLLLLTALVSAKMVPCNRLKMSLFFITLIFLPLLFLMYRNPVGIKNIIHNQISFLQDPGLVTSVNVLQGESKKAGFGILSRLVENKYIYFFKYAILRSLGIIMPTVFFTSEEKLLGFSFSPPLYLGLIFPFLFGLFSMLNSKIIRKYFLVSLVLIIPAYLSNITVDLNRLILFEPMVILAIVVGFKHLYEKKSSLNKTILYICLLMIIFQFLVTLSDINFREYPRFERYFGINRWQIDKQ